MTMTKTILSSIVALTITTQAGGNFIKEDVEIVPTEEAIVMDDSSFYLGMAISPMRLSNDLTDEEFTSTDITLQIGYQYNRYIAIEGRYSTDISSIEYSSGNTANLDIDDFNTSFSNIAIYLKPIYPIANFNIYALIGYGEVSLTNLNGADRAESGFQWGLGAEYKFTNSIYAFVDYTTMYDNEGFDYLGTDTDHRADAWSVGVSYHF